MQGFGDRKKINVLENNHQTLGIKLLFTQHPELPNKKRKKKV